MKKKHNKIEYDDFPALITEILESDFWLNAVRTGEEYERLQDDHDGSFEGKVTVMFSEYGDAFVSVSSQDQPNPRMIRFRTPGGGGGMSPRTRVALLVLAEAIRQDNKKNPIQGMNDPVPS